MNIKQVGLVLFGAVLMGLLAWWTPSTLPSVLGSAPGGYSTTFATGSVDTLVPGIALTMFATSTPDCISRIITTKSEAITIKFGDYTQFALTNLGHIQAASTTVTYDSALYGCGLWQGMGMNGAATTGVNVIVTEFRGFR